MPLILVVDDDADIREVIQMNLESAGYEVMTAGNGVEALDLIKERLPDAMFLDVMMPELDGFSVLEQVKAEVARAAEVPVFMVTGLTGREHQLRGGIEGALRYITKPFDPIELIQALESVLDPASPSEPELRRKVQTDLLAEVARSERLGVDASVDLDGFPMVVEPRVRLTRLEHSPSQPAPRPALRQARARLGELTVKQRELLEALASGRPVTTIAGELGVSRSNIYASLRRIGRKLGLKDTDELLALVRQGGLLEPF